MILNKDDLLLLATFLEHMEERCRAGIKSAREMADESSLHWCQESIRHWDNALGVIVQHHLEVNKQLELINAV